MSLAEARSRVTIAVVVLRTALKLSRLRCAKRNPSALIFVTAWANKGERWHRSWRQVLTATIRCDNKVLPASECEAHASLAAGAQQSRSYDDQTT